MHEKGRRARHARDAALVDHLRRTLATGDPIPASLVRDARDLLAWRTVDADLARLLRAGLARAPR